MKAKAILIIMILMIGFVTLNLFGKIAATENMNNEPAMTAQQTDPADVKSPVGAKIYKEKCVIFHMAPSLRR